MTLGLRPLNPWQGRDGPHSRQACCSITAAAVCPSNTADQLRRAHDLAHVHDDSRTAEWPNMVLPLASNRPSSAASACSTARFLYPPRCGRQQIGCSARSYARSTPPPPSTLPWRAWRGAPLELIGPAKLRRPPDPYRSPPTFELASTIAERTWPVLSAAEQAGTHTALTTANGRAVAGEHARTLGRRSRSVRTNHTARRVHARGGSHGLNSPQPVEHCGSAAKRCPRPTCRRGHRAAPQLAVRVPP
jgi:hypothetical protein